MADSALIGKHWLLLRGLCREAAHWGEFPALLQAALPDATVDTIDLPGTGQFYLQASPNRIEDIVETVREQVRREQRLNQPLTLLAVSLGGMVAWEWSRRYPQEIAGCALLNTSFASVSPFHQRLRWQSYPHIARLLTMGSIGRREAAIVGLVTNRPELHAETGAAWAKIQRSRPVSVQTALRQISAAAHYRPDGHKPEMPLLLLVGRGDRLVAPACSDAIRDKWQIDLHDHPWAGHDLTLDAPEWVIDRLLAWTEPALNGLNPRII